jgi:hypothetical protein
VIDALRLAQLFLAAIPWPRPPEVLRYQTLPEEECYNLYQGGFRVSIIGILNFRFVSDFDIRISDFLT